MSVPHDSRIVDEGGSVSKALRLNTEGENTSFPLEHVFHRAQTANVDVIKFPITLIFTLSGSEWWGAVGGGSS